LRHLSRKHVRAAAIGGWKTIVEGSVGVINKVNLF
jgi:hypothetical protein